MNTSWAITQLDEFIDATLLHPIHRGSGIIAPPSYQTKLNDPEIVAAAQVVEQILDRQVPGWRDFEVVPRSNRWTRHREAAIRAKEQLLREEEVRTNLGDNAPQLSASKLHPWIWDGAKSLWQSSHYRQAAQDAITKLNAETQNKVDRRNLSETKLFQEAFSMSPAEPGKARLRQMSNDGSDTYKSLQRGAMAFAEGIFAGIRNPLSHEADQDLDEQQALEYLAALSVLARWVDAAEVESAS